jgi:hypothetical protein
MAITPIYNVPKTTGDYEPSVAYNMIGKVAKQIIKGVTADNRLEELKRGEINNGETVEDVVFGLVEGSPLVDKVPGEPFSAPEATPAVKYFKNWTTTQYATGLTHRNLRKYLTEGNSIEDIAGIVAGQLAQSEAHDDYTAIRDMFAQGTGDDLPVDVTTDVLGGKAAATTYKELLVALKNTVAGMTFVNDNFNSAGIKRRTLREDVRILMPYQLFNAIEVDELAGVFNLSKAEIQDRIILVDGKLGAADDGAYHVVVFDKNAVQVWTRLYEMTSAFDAQQLRTNYFLTVDRMYGLSPLYDCCYITYNPGVQA